MSDGSAELLRGQPNPIEDLAADQRQVHGGWLSSVSSMADHFLKTGQRLAALQCGHYTVTRALRRAACPRCGAMIRSGYDYDGYRRLGQPDEFSWPDDPLAALHEGRQS